MQTVVFYHKRNVCFLSFVNYERNSRNYPAVEDNKLRSVLSEMQRPYVNRFSWHNYTLMCIAEHHNSMSMVLSVHIYVTVGLTKNLKQPPYIVYVSMWTIHLKLERLIRNCRSSRPGRTTVAPKVRERKHNEARGVAVDLGTHCNIDSMRKCCPLASN